MFRPESRIFCLNAPLNRISLHAEVVVGHGRAVQGGEVDAGGHVVGGLLAAEGMHPLEGELAGVDALFAAGYRMLAPTHFFDNEIGGSAHGERKGGLSELGVRAIDLVGDLNPDF